jgi:hypothetical protein
MSHESNARETSPQVSELRPDLAFPSLSLEMIVRLYMRMHPTASEPMPTVLSRPAPLN